MASEYLIRAKVDGTLTELPKQLPKTFGGFTLDVSKNLERLELLDALERYGVEPNRKIPDKDNDYPMSPLFVDSHVEADDIMQAIEQADGLLEKLEALFRLYQQGNVFVRRYNIWPMENGKPVDPLDRRLEDFFDDMAPSYQVKPDPVPLYNRPEYPLDDEKFNEFVDFFNKYWPIVSQEMQPLDIAIARFSSSYEKRILEDRLVDLVTALEALFGGRRVNKEEIARRACLFIYPPDGDREKAAASVVETWAARHDAVHGNPEPAMAVEDRIEQFEQFVRQAIAAVLEEAVSGLELDKECRIDTSLADRRWSSTRND